MRGVQREVRMRSGIYREKRERGRKRESVISQVQIGTARILLLDCLFN